jgi:putative copper export protein
MLAQWVLLVSLACLAAGVVLPAAAGRITPVQPLLHATLGLRHGWLMLWATIALACAIAALILQSDGRAVVLSLARAGLAASIGLLAWRRRGTTWPAIAAVALLLLSQSLLSRSAMLPDWPAHVAVDWLHLVLTSLWLGGVGLLAASAPLVLAERALVEPFSAALDRFSPLAMFCVLGLGVSGLIQSSLFLGGIEELWTTGYGRALLAKLALFAVLIAFGAFHQQAIAPRLRLWRLRAARSDAEQAATLLRASLLAEAIVGAALLAAVAVMKGWPVAG